MEANKQKRPVFLLSTIFHILHVCVTIGLVITVIHYQLVNESRFERLEKKDCKCPGKNEAKTLARDKSGVTAPHLLTKRAVDKSSNQSLVSCFYKLKVILHRESQITAGKKDKRRDGCSLLRAGLKGDPGDKGEPGPKGAMGPRGCSGTSLASPTFGSSPRQLVFNEGDPAVLSCNATANPSAHITWYRNNVMLSGNRDNRYTIYNREIQVNTTSSRANMCPGEIPHPVTQSNLVIKQSRGSDTGTYVCKARNILGVYNYKIQIVVQVHVQFTKRPVNLTVVQGNDVRLPCRASGVPAPVITWYRKDRGSMPRRHRVNNGRLHIPDISKAEGGTFVCLATNVLGSKTTEATITVNVFPTITSFLDHSLTINESHTLVLPCNATGYPKPEIRWSKVNDYLPAGRYVYDSQGLNISRVNYEDRGRYICTAVNTVGRSVKNIDVLVQVGPKTISKPNAFEHGYRERTKRLSFQVFSFPKSNVTWRKPYWASKSDARFRQENGDLIIENVQYTDSGQYQATAWNILGEVKVTTFMVVRDAVPPFIRKKLPSTTVLKRGQNFSIDCDVGGVPAPKIVWKTPRSNRTIDEKTLKIPDAGYGDIGNYTCTAENEFGGLQQHLIISGFDKANIRLVGSTSYNEGRVEVFHNGQWGTVCDDGWGIVDARVVCRQLGFKGARSAPSRAAFGKGSGPTWLDDVSCVGTENALQDCGHRGWGIENCSHDEDASVVCDP